MGYTVEIKDENGRVHYELKPELKNMNYDFLWIIGNLEKNLKRQGFDFNDILSLAYHARKNLDEQKKVLTEEQNELLEWEESRDIKVKEILHILEHGIWAVEKNRWGRYEVSFYDPSQLSVDLYQDYITVFEPHDNDYGDDYWTKITDFSASDLGSKFFFSKEEATKVMEEKNAEIQKKLEEKKLKEKNQ